MIILDNSVNKTLIHEAANCSSQLQEIVLYSVSALAMHIVCNICTLSLEIQPNAVQPYTPEPGAKEGSVQKEPI